MCSQLQPTVKIIVIKMTQYAISFHQTTNIRQIIMYLSYAYSYYRTEFQYQYKTLYLPGTQYYKMTHLITELL